ncbi:MAG: hypothetical protein U9O24_04860 [Campylobacterota bacterium]|nr:hypothetical protein [Campylobacterota bacterium]
MYSYIGTHHYIPKPDYQPLERLIPLIDQALVAKQAVTLLGEENLFSFREGILACMEVYYQFVGINDEVIASGGVVEPCGVLPRYVEGLIGYFEGLQREVPTNKESEVLEYSGVKSIKVRYKYTSSVIKKLVKLGLRNPKVLEKPLQLFLKGGVLHDLIGMQFICSYPYEKEWVARTLYNFFEYDNRTDDHLLYGFYRVDKKSGYRGLHCDHTIFNPRFDASIKCNSHATSVEPETLFSLLEPQDEGVVVLRKLKDYFNIEIQLHTTFESLWSSMEHTNNYNTQAKGVGRNSKITVQWKLLSNAMQNLEEQFERLQIDTEQARFDVAHHGVYIPVKNLLSKLGSTAYPVYEKSVKKVENLEDLLVSHEISRQDYASALQKEISYIDKFSQEQEHFTVRIIFKMQSAFIYYGLANQSEYFNAEDIHEFVKISLKYYKEITATLLEHTYIYKGNLLNIVSLFRYLYLGQKYGFGFVKSQEDINTKTLSSVTYEESLHAFKTAIALFNSLEEEDIEFLKKDSAISLKIIHHYDVLAREWELFNQEDENEAYCTMLAQIEQFKKRFISTSLYMQFNTLLESDKIKNIGFVVKFYTTLVWHGFLRPRDALKQIIRYSAYDKIKASDLFYYEVSAYRFLVIQRCESVEDCHKVYEERCSDEMRITHFKNYHRKNMIHLLFRIKRNESLYNFYKAKRYFEMLTQTEFKIDHFSDTLVKEIE